MNFEDALQYYSAKSVKADYIITRNTRILLILTLRFLLHVSLPLSIFNNSNLPTCGVSVIPFCTTNITHITKGLYATSHRGI